MKEKRYFNGIKKNLGGFTLIELLVVISIIGLLSSLGMVALNSARIKARDALRMGEMAQLRTALGMYYDEHNAYPICDNWIDDASQDYGASVSDASGTGGCWCFVEAMEADLKFGARAIMPEVPHDPLNPTNSCSANGVFNFRYVSDEFGQQYAVAYTLEESGEKFIRGW